MYQPKTYPSEWVWRTSSYTPLPPIQEAFAKGFYDLPTTLVDKDPIKHVIAIGGMSSNGQPYLLMKDRAGVRTRVHVTTNLEFPTVDIEVYIENAVAAKLVITPSELNTKHNAAQLYSTEPRSYLFRGFENEHIIAEKLQAHKIASSFPGLEALCALPNLGHCGVLEIELMASNMVLSMPPLGSSMDLDPLADFVDQTGHKTLYILFSVEGMQGQIAEAKARWVAGALNRKHVQLNAADL